MNTKVYTTCEGAVAVVRVDNPPVNALSDEVLDGLIAGLVSADADPDVRALVLTGSGSRAFLAGADLAEFVDMRRSTLAIADHTARTRRLLDELGRLAAPVIAAVQAHALGGGLEVALACDLIVADERARLGCPEVKLGLIPGAGGTQRLTQALGRHRATELILTGSQLSARDAAGAGLVAEVTVAGAALEKAVTLAQEIASRPAVAVRAAKRAVRAGDAALLAGLEQERREFLATLASADSGEGIAAFLEKRTPVFSHS